LGTSPCVKFKHYSLSDPDPENRLKNARANGFMYMSDMPKDPYIPLREEFWESTILRSLSYTKSDDRTFLKAYFEKHCEDLFDPFKDMLDTEKNIDIVSKVSEIINTSQNPDIQKALLNLRRDRDYFSSCKKLKKWPYVKFTDKSMLEDSRYAVRKIYYETNKWPDIALEDPHPSTWNLYGSRRGYPDQMLQSSNIKIRKIYYKHNGFPKDALLEDDYSCHKQYFDFHGYGRYEAKLSGYWRIRYKYFEADKWRDSDAEVDAFKKIRETYKIESKKISRGEKEINKHFKKSKYSYVSQKTFPDCKDKALLRYDFYLPKYNTLVEFDGEQHFKPVEIFGGQEGYEDRIRKDRIKDEHAKKNGIRLIRLRERDLKNLDKVLCFN